MARQRPHTTQLSFPIRKLPRHPKSRARHGGLRPGAGRPNLSGLQAHVRRARFSGRCPAHVTIRLRDGLPSLRSRAIFPSVKEAIRTARRKGLAVAHFAILSNHVHLLVEPPKGIALGRQIQSFEIALARRLNRLAGDAGPAFRERYHVRELRTPGETRNALAYVLTNAARHAGQGRFGVRFDPFSSILALERPSLLLGGRPRLAVTGWSEDSVRTWLEKALSQPRTWLLRKGWERARA